MDIVNHLLTDKKVFSVSELNRQTKNLLSNYFSQIQVEGEISNLSVPSSGHIYFSLKDSKSQIRCAMFKSKQRGLNFKPQNGKQVILTGQVSLYETRGDYQLIIDKMDQAGEGNLQRTFDQLKAKLSDEGLFELNLKKPLPQIPKKIGIITSPTGAAIHDILSVLKRRFPAIPVLVYPSSVQGEIAKFEIVHAIDTANQQAQVDVIILARGGGSLEDLWAFNEESVARAIVKSTIPIIAAIGHEVDFTIADFVADLRAPTPSVAAENAVPDQQLWFSNFQSIEKHLQQIILRQITQHRQSINWLNSRLKQQHPGQQLQHHAQSLDGLEIRLFHNIQTKIKNKTLQLEKQRGLFQRINPKNKIMYYQQQQRYLCDRLNNALQHKLKTLQNNYISLVQTLNAVSPLATLERGYSIICNPTTSQVINSSQQLSVNERIKIRLAHGQADAQIKEIQHD